MVNRLLTVLLLVLMAPPAFAQEPASGPAGQAEPAPLDRRVAEPAGRDARVAMLATALFPGLGQLYNEEGLRTLVVFAWESYYIAVILREGLSADLYKRRAAALGEGETWDGLGRSALRDLFHFHEERQKDYVWYTAALFFASVLDAYVFANLYGFETDDIRGGRRAAILPVFDEGAVGLSLRFNF